MTPLLNRVAAAAVSCLVAACGGASSDTSTRTPTETAQSAAPASVQLEGCVLGPHDQPRAASVRALGEDGRLIGHAHSNAEGVFSLRVPAGAHLSLALEGEPGLAVMTGQHNVSLGGCLRLSA